MNIPDTARAGIAGSELIDEAPAAIVATAPDGTLTVWNRRAEQLFGYTAEEAIGRTPEELGASGAGAALGSRARDGGVWEGEVAAVRKDGKHIRVHIVSSPITDADGKPAGSVSIALEAAPADGAQPAQMRLELLLQASELLARSLDADAGLQGVARLAASWLADVCAFDLL
ncbi:MAG TPA: PAS domain-containing protein, partial [Gaiellales bacterium]